MNDTELIDWMQKHLVTYTAGLEADGRIDADSLAAALTEHEGDLRKAVQMLAASLDA